MKIFYDTEFIEDGHTIDLISIGMVRKDGRDFIAATDAPELWADYGAYDHVALCQLWGSMVRLPDGVPMFTHELRQELSRLDVADADLPVQADGAHNALADARHLAALDEHLAAVARGQR